MSTYRVHMRAMANTTIEVEASSEDEAMNLAFEQTPYLCAHCAGWGQGAGIEISDWSPVDEPWPALTADVAVEEVQA